VFAFDAASVSLAGARQTSFVFARSPRMTSSRTRANALAVLQTLALATSASALALAVLARRRRALALDAFLRRERAASAPRTSPDETNVLVLIAHPDDEAYFFAPTIQALKQSSRARVHLCCLCSGDAGGAGETRKKELLRVKEALAIDALVVVDTDDLRDGMTTVWPLETIGAVLDAYSEGVAFDFVVTFDEAGISGHANHIATHLGTKAWLEKKRANARNEDEERLEKIPEVWVLESTNVARKLSGVLDFAASFTEAAIVGDRRVFIPSPNPLEVIKVCRMHKSQFVWYRKLFVLFSRFTYMNTLRRIE